MNRTNLPTTQKKPAPWMQNMKKAAIYMALLLPLSFYGCSGDGGGGNDGGDDKPNEVTVMSSTGNMPSSGVLTAQYADSPEGYELQKAVDGNTSTKFVTNHSSFHLLWTGNVSSVVNNYTLTSANDAAEKDPKSWTLAGSNDNQAWVTLDTKSGQLFSTRGEKKEYTISNETSYKYYRLTVDSNNGGNATQIAEFTLKNIPTDIDDLMVYSSGSSYSANTPMGNHYANKHVTTDNDRTWLANAANEPPVPATNANDLYWATFPVTLYPYGDPSPADINQHSIGNCSALAIFASFAYMYPEFTKSLITDNGDNTYTVAMFDPQGNPVNVTVSSKFLAGSNGKIAALSGKNDIATWGTVLEKAIIKWNVIYQVNPDINGIGSEHVAPLFTGDGDSFAFSPGRLNGSQLARVAEYCLRNGKIIVGGFNPGGLYIGSYQTVSGHAYTIMHSLSATALFSMRNPWGFSPGSNGSEDGVLNIPNNSTIPPTIDFRIIEPGIAGPGSVTEPYRPPLFAVSAANTRVSAELMRSGM